METLEYFQSRIDELLQDREYYFNELKEVRPDMQNPSWAMMQKKSYTKLIEECEANIMHYKKAVTAVKNHQYQEA